MSFLGSRHDNGYTVLFSTWALGNRRFKHCDNDNKPFNIVFIQLGACISIVVGQYLGAGELEKAKDADNKMIVFSVFCCSVMAAVMLLVGGLFPQIYNTTDEIKSLATSFIAVSAIIMPFVHLHIRRISHSAQAARHWSHFCLTPYLRG